MSPIDLELLSAVLQDTDFEYAGFFRPGRHIPKIILRHPRLDLFNIPRIVEYYNY